MPSCWWSCHHRMRRRKRTARSRHRCDAWVCVGRRVLRPRQPPSRKACCQSASLSRVKLCHATTFSTLGGPPTTWEATPHPLKRTRAAPSSRNSRERALEAHQRIPPVSPPNMAAPRTTTPTQLPTVVLEPAPSTPPPAPTPKRYDTVDRPRVVLTTSPEVRKLQTLFRSACHDSPRLVPGARAGARSPASFSSLSPRSPRPGRESPTRRSPRRRPRSRGGPEGCSSPLFGRPSPRRSPLLSTPPPTQPLSSPRGLGGR